MLAILYHRINGQYGIQREKQLQRKKHFTSDIDQDPKKKLVINVKPVTVFKSNVSVQQSSSLFSLTNLSQAELQGPVNTIYN